MNLQLTFMLLAAGSGQRFGYSKNKLLYKYKNQALFTYLWQTLVTFSNSITGNSQEFCANLLSIWPLLHEKICLAEQAKQADKTKAQAFLSALQTASIDFQVNFIIVCQSADKEAFKLCVQANLPNLASVFITEGADNREASMLKALEAYTNSQAETIQSAHNYKCILNKVSNEKAASELIFVHDAARLQIKQSLIERLLLTAWLYGSAIPALPVTDTIIKLHSSNLFTSNKDTSSSVSLSSFYTDSERLKRSELVALQTPQVFTLANLDRLRLSLKAHDVTLEQLANYTDDSSLYETFVEPVNYVLGQADNYKLTHPSDLNKLKL